jgi:hypothetical protein
MVQLEQLAAVVNHPPLVPQEQTVLPVHQAQVVHRVLQVVPVLQEHLLPQVQVEQMVQAEQMV